MAGEVFIGRRDEQARFAALLKELTASRGWRWRRRAGVDPMGAAKSRVVLVHGLGGSGKSTLLRQFQAMAEGRGTDRNVSAVRATAVWLDWENERQDDPGAYAATEGPSLVTVLDAVQRAVIGAFEGDGRATERSERAFADYRSGAARMPQYMDRFADVLAQARLPGSSFTGQDAGVLLKSLASAGLVAGGHPGGLLGLTPEQIAAAAQAGGHLSTAAVRAVTGKKSEDLPAPEYRLVTEPQRELPRRVAAAIRTIAGRRPMVCFLDTGEIIGDRAWGWLRAVMSRTGPRVIWVVGARFETEAEAGFDSPVARFVRDIGDAHLLLMSPTRFDDAMIRAYLESRYAGTYAEAQIDAVARFTRGVPLAVSITATLLNEGQPLEDVCREMDHGHPGTVVSRLARRYLVHAEQYPSDDPRHDDVTKILGLALAYTDLRNDPDLLAALWDTTDSLTAYADLARRHDFVLPTSRRLHDDVRDTLRTDLLDPYRRRETGAINQRAAELFRTRLSDMRDRWPTLDDQLEHTGYTTTLLALLWHTLWADKRAGLDAFIEILPVLAAAHPATADAAAALMDRFTDIFDDDERRDLDLLTENRSEDLRDGQLVRRRRARITPRGIALRPSTGTITVDPLIGAPGDRELAVTILKAYLCADARDYQSAITHLRSAKGHATSARLRQAIGDKACSIARRLIWARPDRTTVRSEIGLTAVELAVSTLPDSALVWSTYGAGLREFGRVEEALAAYDQAITRNASAPVLQANRGLVLIDLGRFEEAVAACDEAVRLYPDYQGYHNGRGAALFALGRYTEALAAFDRAITLSPDVAVVHANKGILLAVTGDLTQAIVELDAAENLAQDGDGEAAAWAGAILWHQGNITMAKGRFTRVVGRVTGCTPFHTAEMEALALCGLAQPDCAEQRLSEAIHLRRPGDDVERHVIYSLLSDPPMPGIDRLRAIIDQDSGET